MGKMKERLHELHDLMNDTLFDEAHDAWHSMEDEIEYKKDECMDDIMDRARAILEEEGFDEADFEMVIGEDLYDYVRDTVNDAWNF